MEADIERVLIDRDQIAHRVRELAGQIVEDLCGPRGPAQADEITLVPILTGSFIFVADLIRHLPLYMQIRMLSVTSYPGTATTSQGARLDHDLSGLPADLSGLHALVIDDILDTGNTLKLVDAELRRRGPESVSTCVLLRKRRAEPPVIEADYFCFEIPDEFVVGYGLDFNDRYRNLPDIAVLREAVYKGAG